MSLHYSSHFMRSGSVLRARKKIPANPLFFSSRVKFHFIGAEFYGLVNLWKRRWALFLCRERFRPRSTVNGPDSARK